MPYITKSKEAYKRMPHVRSELNPLRVVRGLYISGKWLPANYSDICIQVKSISSQKAKVVDYTTTYKTLPYEPLLNLITFKGTNSIKIIDYTTEFKTPPYEPLLNLITFKATNKIQRIDYTTDSKITPYEPLLNLITFKATNRLKVKTIIQNRSTYGTRPEHTITIRTFTSTKATVENYKP